MSREVSVTPISLLPMDPFLWVQGYVVGSCSAVVCSDHRGIGSLLWILSFYTKFPDSDEKKSQDLRVLVLKFLSTAKLMVPSSWALQSF